MALTFQAWVGFETGDSTSVSQSSGTLDYGYATKKSGNYGLRVDTNTAGAGSDVAYAGIYERDASGRAPSNNAASVGTGALWGFWFYPKVLPVSNSEEICAINSAGTPATVFLRIKSDGKLQLYNSDGTTQAGSDSTTALSVNTWYYIEVLANSGTAGACTGKVWIGSNSSPEISTTTGTFGTSGTAYDGLFFGKTVNRNTQKVDFVYDDAFYAATDSASESRIGPLILPCLRPAGNGNYTQWTGTYADVDEATAGGDTTYAVSTAANDAETYILESASGVVGSTIKFVASVIQSKRGGVGAVVKMRLRSGSTDSDATSFSATSAYSTTTVFLTTNPADSAAWEVADLANVEVGAVEDSTSTQRVRMTWAGLYVLCSEPVVGGSLILSRRALRQQHLLIR